MISRRLHRDWLRPRTTAYKALGGVPRRAMALLPLSFRLT